jgi:TonB family protein
MIKSDHRKPAILRWSLSITILALMFYIFACDTNDNLSLENMADLQFPEVGGTEIISLSHIESETYRKTVEEWIKNNSEKSYVIITSKEPHETMAGIFEMGDWEIPSFHMDTYQDETILYAVVCHSPGYLFADQIRKNDFPESAEVNSNMDDIFTIVDNQPVPQGGMKTFYQYVVDHLKYPEVAKKEGIEGKVFVEFVIRKDGSVDQVKVLKGIHPSCDEEARRVISQSPAWTPGYHDGKAVDVRMILPITYKL